MVLKNTYLNLINSSLPNFPPYEIWSEAYINHVLGDRGKVRISLTPIKCIQFVLMHSFNFFYYFCIQWILKLGTYTCAKYKPKISLFGKYRAGDIFECMIAITYVGVHVLRNEGLM